MPKGKTIFLKIQYLLKLAKKHQKSVAKVVLRFLIQDGIVVIPRSTQKARTKENFDVFNFTLLGQEMNLIVTLDTGHSLFFSHQDPKTVEWFMSIVKEFLLDLSYQHITTHLK